jgi:hypothetical protein
MHYRPAFLCVNWPDTDLRNYATHPVIWPKFVRIHWVIEDEPAQLPRADELVDLPPISQKLHLNPRAIVLYLFVVLGCPQGIQHATDFEGLNQYPLFLVLLFQPLLHISLRRGFMCLLSAGG